MEFAHNINVHSATNQAPFALQTKLACKFLLNCSFEGGRKGRKRSKVGWCGVQVAVRMFKIGTGIGEWSAKSG